jgi:hypothetical protein
MFHDTVIVDYLSLDGTLTTYSITPKEADKRVVSARLQDIDSTHEVPNTVDIGSVRLYDSSAYTIQILEAKLSKQNFSLDNDLISFSWEQMNIPLRTVQDRKYKGNYDFILPTGFRFTELHIVDPYDNSNKDIEHKKHFRNKIQWDTKCNTSLVSMELSSKRSEFSFIIAGKAKIFVPEDNENYLPVDISDNVITLGVMSLLSNHNMQEQARENIVGDILKKSEWLELKPNVMGIGINLNAIISDSIKMFREKFKRWS